MYSGPKEAALGEREKMPPRGYNVHCIIELVFAFYCAVHFTEYLVSQNSSRLGTVNYAMYKSQYLHNFFKRQCMYPAVPLVALAPPFENPSITAHISLFDRLDNTASPISIADITVR